MINNRISAYNKVDGPVNNKEQLQSRLSFQPELRVPFLYPQADRINVSAKNGVPASSVKFESEDKFIIHKVESGDSLSTISQKYTGGYNKYQEIFEFNKGKNLPNLNSPLKIGQEIKIPLDIMSDDKKNQFSSKVKKETEQADTIIEKNFSPAINNEDDPFFIGPPKPPVKQSFADYMKEFFIKDISTSDAIKVNKSFDSASNINTGNFALKFAEWASETAKTMAENNSTIVIEDKNNNKIGIGADFLNKLAEKHSDSSNKYQAYKEIKDYFNKELGIAFFNTMWAIDDIAVNLKSDPFFKDKTSYNKSFDLSAVKEEFNITNDNKNYLGGIKSHKHRFIPMSIEEIFPIEHKSPSKSAKELIKTLSSCFDNGKLKDKDKFTDTVYESLKNNQTRKNLIDYFELNNPENSESLITALTAEAGVAQSQQDYNSYFAVGSVMINHTLGRNLKNAALNQSKGIAPEKIKAIPLESVIKEKGQFAITWENIRGVKGPPRTIYQYQNDIYNLYKNNKLKEDGNSFQSFKLAEEVINDLGNGMNKLKAELNGKIEKNSGRSTADIFYFNQSHDEDYSKPNQRDYAVKIADKNSTHVFFKTWSGTPFFL